MSDITKCKGLKCPLKNSCYRFTVEGHEHLQAYFTELPFNEFDNDCDYYIPNDEQEEKDEFIKDFNKLMNDEN
jgi:hypothetical protein